MAFITLALFFVTCCLFCNLFSDKIFPPGPKFGLPGIGNLLDIAWESLRTKLPQHILMSRWAVRYGKVFSFWLGSEFVVVINDVEVARNAFSNDDLVDRPKILNFWYPNGIGVAFSSGETWVDQKKAVMATFKHIEKDRSLDKIVRTEIGCLIAEFKASSGSPLDPQDIVQKAAFNLVSSFIFGQRFSYDDKLLNNFVDCILKKNKLYSDGTILAFLSALKKTPKMAALLDQYMKLHETQIEICNEFIKQHKKKFNRNRPRDLIDSWFLEMEGKKSQNMESSALSENNLIATILTLYPAGFQTLRSYLVWLILYMSTYPEIQRKMQAEMDQVVGRDRLPEMTDEPELPYTAAVIMEVLRINPPPVFIVPHCAAKDTYVQEFFVPKDATIMGNSWYMFRDPEIWEDPEEFIPDRFINEDGTFNPRSDIFTPFGVGRRACIGEQLARKVLFLFTAHFMHQLNFELPADSPPVSFEGDVGTFNIPKPHDIVVIGRAAKGD